MISKLFKKIPVLICFIIILCLGYICIQIIPPLLYQDNNSSNKLINNSSSNNCPQYIKDFVEKNPQAIELETNYTATVTNDPINLSVPKGIPLYLQWDSRWAFNQYGEEIIGTAGCGPTCLSMVSVGLTGDTTYNPRYVANYAQDHGYLDGSKTTWNFMQSGCQAFGIKATPVALDETAMKSQLEQGHPIICSVRSGDFTDTGHFIVITKCKNDKFIINDPNSHENSQRSWSYERLSWQIKAMWAYSLI